MNQIRVEDRLTVPQCAELLGVSSKTVSRLVQQRRIPHYRKNPRGRPVWFLRHEVEQWVREEWRIEDEG